MALRKLDDPGFNNLKADIEGHPRAHGYYIVDLVAIPGYPQESSDHDKFLDALFQYFDDQEWPPPHQRPMDQTWDDYEVDRERAKLHLVEALVGGNNIGQTKDTTSPSLAREFWKRYDALFSASCRYYMGMALGDPVYAFQQGVAIVDNEKAGILAIVEND